ncbi:MAG: hypothetical protein FPO08_18240 [Geobacter sp.]|uniref:hypothetical protein n=1 Tax=Geomonas ferrireducens TaxID=2570227 RepID=UPI0010A7FCB3|nr:hypothetical protein [Geomonas ferrireducens]TSK04273.1 MAG: hypothetical protein FPO08_18240 [Geobacter sp.]
MEIVLKAATLMVLATLVNIPLGYQRQSYPKFSFAWYFYVHISIPAIIYFRIKTGLGWGFIPFSISSAVLGQIIGGRTYRKRHPVNED